MTDAPTIATIEAAALRLQGHVLRSPLLNAPALDAMAGRRVFIKAECLQPTGSFKARGGWAAVSALAPEDRARGVIACSSGNHAQGVARAAAALGAPCVIVMPDDAPRVKIDATLAPGAEVILYDRATTDRDVFTDALARERGLHLIHPFDNVQVMAGQGTAGLELAEQAAEVGALSGDVLVCCGGGGLASGVALALESRAPGLRVRPCEPAGFDDMARSLATGQRVQNATPGGSICDAIVTRAPGHLTLPVLSRLAGPGLVVTDDEAQHAVALAFRHLRVVLEPGGAVSLAAALFRRDEIAGDTVFCIATGGNVDLGLFRAALEQFA